MDYNDDASRPVRPVGPISPAERVKRMISALGGASSPSGAGHGKQDKKAPGEEIHVDSSRNLRILALKRAVDYRNKKPDISEKNIKIELEPQGDVYSLLLVRISDRAVIHKSRPLPLYRATATNANLIVEDFVRQDKSLARFE